MAKTPKLAQTIARRIERDILNRRRPVGYRLGSETELTSRYQVSRAVLREAIRIVERHQLAETRRGAGGGFFVCQPPRRAMASVLSGYLESIGLEVAELFEARRYIETVTAELAAKRIDEDGALVLEKIATPEEVRRSLEEDVERHERFHTTLADLSHNPALALFVHALHRVSQDVGLSMGFSQAESAQDTEQLWEEKRRIARAVTAGNANRARRLMNDHLLERQAYLERQPARRRRRVVEAKRASGLARQIGDQVRRRRWLPGRRIGSEPELTERFGVSRSIFREAVRMLEQHGIAEMRRGIRGGLYVSEPDPSAVVLSASVYLAHIGLEAESVHEVRLSLEPLAASLAAERASKQQLESLAASLERELACGDNKLFREARTLHEQIADLCGNRALALFIRVVITAVWGDAEVEPANLPPGWREQLRANHEKLVRATLSGDPRRARKCMEEHLDTTTGWWPGLHSPS